MRCSIADCRFIGRVTVGNKNGLLLPSTCSDKEMQHIKNSLPDKARGLPPASAMPPSLPPSTRGDGQSAKRAEHGVAGPVDNYRAIGVSGYLAYGPR